MKKEKQKWETVCKVTLFFVLLLMGLIFYFSGENANQSSDLSGGVCEEIISVVERTFCLQWNEAQKLKYAEILETPIRKGAHFTEYAMLSIAVNFYLLSILALERETDFYKKKRKWKKLYLWRSVWFCFLYALSDEFHQYFIPGRACRFFDVCVDTTGAVFGLLLFWGIFRKSNLLDDDISKG